ncbi:MAG: apolipoprotein N-acyltransferase [Pseudomonadota bacterium]
MSAKAKPVNVPHSSLRLTLVAAAFGGLAGALGHAPFGLWPVAVPGFATLIWAVVRGPRPALTAWIAGTAYFGVTLHWIVEPFLVDAARHGWMAPFALILLAGGLALFWGLAGWLSARMWGPRALTFAVALAGAEVLRGHIFTGFPWVLPAYIWADTPLRLSVALIGSYGLTLLTLVAAALPFVARQKVGLRSSILGLGLLGLAAIPGLGPTYPEDENDHLGTVRIIQPNIDQAEKWDPDLAPGHFQDMLELTRAPGGPLNDPDLVVWPEVAVVSPLDLAAPALEAIGAAAGVPVITGINRREDGRWYNSLVVAAPSGQVTETYDKVHLVPFGEYIPFGIPLLRQMAGTSSNGFAAGEAVRLIDTPLGRALPLICYEGIFPGHAFKAGERADYILILTNDAWFGTFAGPQQHLDIARFRAAEHRLAVVRVANKGVSSVIDPYGNLEMTLLADAPEATNAIVHSDSGVTFYARTGDTPLKVLLFLAIVSAVVAHLRKRIAHPPGLG